MLTRVLVGLALLVILAIAFGAMMYRHTYGTFNPFAIPEKITVSAYDRQFINPGAVMTKAQMVADESAPPTVVGSLSWFPGITIGRPSIWGDANAACVVVVYLQTGPDQFVPYGLSGGC